jgi:hypothetical protein
MSDYHMDYESINDFIEEWGAQPDENNFPVSSFCDFDNATFYLTIAQERKSRFARIKIKNFNPYDASLRYPKWKVPDFSPDNNDYQELYNKAEQLEQENAKLKERIIDLEGDLAETKEQASEN